MARMSSVSLLLRKRPALPANGSLNFQAKEQGSMTVPSKCLARTHMRMFSAETMQMRVARQIFQKAEEWFGSGTMQQDMYSKISRAAISIDPQLAKVETCLHERPILLKFAEKGDVKEVIRLVGNGADVNLTDKHGTSPLLVAVRAGHVDTVKALVKCGANVNHAGAWHFTPLMYAAIFGHPEIARYLISHGADPSPKDRRGITALVYAVCENQCEVVEVIDKGFDRINNPPSLATD